jgi:hypothetical protein
LGSGGAMQDDIQQIQQHYGLTAECASRCGVVEERAFNIEITAPHFNEDGN